MNRSAAWFDLRTILVGMTWATDGFAASADTAEAGTSTVTALTASCISRSTSPSCASAACVTGAWESATCLRAAAFSALLSL